VTAEVWAGVQKSVKGKEVTVQGDGWTDLNNHHLIALMIMAAGKVHSTSIHPTTP